MAEAEETHQGEGDMENENAIGEDTYDIISNIVRIGNKVGNNNVGEDDRSSSSVGSNRSGDSDSSSDSHSCTISLMHAENEVAAVTAGCRRLGHEQVRETSIRRDIRTEMTAASVLAPSSASNTPSLGRTKEAAALADPVKHTTTRTTTMTTTTTATATNERSLTTVNENSVRDGAATAIPAITPSPNLTASVVDTGTNETTATTATATATTFAAVASAVTPCQGRENPVATSVAREQEQEERTSKTRELHAGIPFASHARNAEGGASRDGGDDDDDNNNAEEERARRLRERVLSIIPRKPLFLVKSPSKGIPSPTSSSTAAATTTKPTSTHRPLNMSSSPPSGNNNNVQITNNRSIHKGIGNVNLTEEVRDPSASSTQPFVPSPVSSVAKAVAASTPNAFRFESPSPRPTQDSNHAKANRCGHNSDGTRDGDVAVPDLEEEDSEERNAPAAASAQSDTYRNIPPPPSPMKSTTRENPATTTHTTTTSNVPERGSPRLRNEVDEPNAANRRRDNKRDEGTAAIDAQRGDASVGSVCVVECGRGLTPNTDAVSYVLDSDDDAADFIAAWERRPSASASSSSRNNACKSETSRRAASKSTVTRVEEIEVGAKPPMAAFPKPRMDLWMNTLRDVLEDNVEDGKNRWTVDEVDRYYEGYVRYGKDFEKIQALIPNKTPRLVKSYFRHFEQYKLNDLIYLEQELFKSTHVGSVKTKRMKEEESKNEDNCDPMNDNNIIKSATRYSKRTRNPEQLSRRSTKRKYSGPDFYGLSPDNISCANNSSSSSPSINKGMWTEEEESNFVKAYDRYGRDFDKYYRIIKTRTTEQIKRYASTVDFKTKGGTDTTVRKNLPNGIVVGRWSPEEEERFAKCLLKYGESDFEKFVSKIKTRDLKQIVSHWRAQYKWYRHHLYKFEPDEPNAGTWNQEEEEAFLKGLHRFGVEDFRRYVPLVRTRTSNQIKMHYRKRKQHYERILREINTKKAQSNQQTHAFDGKGSRVVEEARNKGEYQDKSSSTARKEQGLTKLTEDHLKSRSRSLKHAETSESESDSEDSEDEVPLKQQRTEKTKSMKGTGDRHNSLSRSRKYAEIIECESDSEDNNDEESRKKKRTENACRKSDLQEKTVTSKRVLTIMANGDGSNRSEKSSARKDTTSESTAGPSKSAEDDFEQISKVALEYEQKNKIKEANIRKLKAMVQMKQNDGEEQELLKKLQAFDGDGSNRSGKSSARKVTTSKSTTRPSKSPKDDIEQIWKATLEYEHQNKIKEANIRKLKAMVQMKQNEREEQELLKKLQEFDE